MAFGEGDTIDRYTVKSVLGRGGMAEVYLVQHRQLGSWHAMKVLTTPSADVLSRLLQEGRAQAQLRHDHIVAVTDVVNVSGSPGLVMEYVSGPDLGDFIAAHRCSLAQIDLIARGFICGVAAAHEHGLVHRDLKPANILMAVSDVAITPKVSDFGLVKVVSGNDPADQSMTRSGMAMGTPSYMAPEQVRDTKSIDHRADVFAVGAILYELLTGRKAFDGEDMMETFSVVVAGDYPPIVRRGEAVPPRMKQAIEGALTVDVDERIQTCAELLEIWTGGLSHEAAFDGDEVRWPPELLQEAREMGAGEHAVNISSGSEGWSEWSGESPAHTFTPDSNVQEPPSPASQPPSPASQPPSPQTSSSSVLTLGILLLVSAVGWLWFDQSRKLDGPASRGQGFEPTAPARPGPPEVPRADQPTPVEDKEPERERREEARERDREESEAKRVEPAPATPEPKAEAEAQAVTVPTTGSVSVSGSIKKVRLRGKSGRLYGPGDVPPGAYNVLIPRGGKLERVLQIEIKAGEHRTLKCNNLGCR